MRIGMTSNTVNKKCKKSPKLIKYLEYNYELIFFEL